MSGTMRFNFEGATRAQTQAEQLVDRARKQAEQEGVKFPANPSVFGDYSGNVWFSYTSNDCKRIIRQAAIDEGFTVDLPQHLL